MGWRFLLARRNICLQHLIDLHKDLARDVTDYLIESRHVKYLKVTESCPSTRVVFFARDCVNFNRLFTTSQVFILSREALLEVLRCDYVNALTLVSTRSVVWSVSARKKDLGDDSLEMHTLWSGQVCVKRLRYLVQITQICKSKDAR